MAARVTAAQARAMGADVPAGRKSKRRARAPYKTRCTTCGQRFITEKAETDHLRETGHSRYELDIRKEAHDQVPTEEPSALAGRAAVEDEGPAP